MWNVFVCYGDAAKKMSETVPTLQADRAEVRGCDVFVGQTPAPWVWYPLLVEQRTTDPYWGP